MDLLYDTPKNGDVKYGYLVFNVIKGVNLNHFNVYLKTNEETHQTDEDNRVDIGEEIPLYQLKKLYQFLGFVLSSTVKESEAE
jgi:hypothetical protein